MMPLMDTRNRNAPAKMLRERRSGQSIVGVAPSGSVRVARGGWQKIRSRVEQSKAKMPDLGCESSEQCTAWVRQPWAMRIAFGGGSPKATDHVKEAETPPGDLIVDEETNHHDGDREEE